jgi:hypothetical protein
MSTACIATSKTGSPSTNFKRRRCSVAGCVGKALQTFRVSSMAQWRFRTSERWCAFHREYCVRRSGCSYRGPGHSGPTRRPRCPPTLRHHTRDDVFSHMDTNGSKSRTGVARNSSIEKGYLTSSSGRTRTYNPLVGHNAQWIVSSADRRERWKQTTWAKSRHPVLLPLSGPDTALWAIAPAKSRHRQEPGRRGGAQRPKWGRPRWRNDA